jgi:hypothetical protein
METTLRPMTLGEILDRTAQLYRSNFVLFAGIAAVYAGVCLVLNLLQIGLTELLRVMHLTQQLPWVTLGFLLLILPLILIFAGAAVAANNRAVAWVNLSEPATIRGAYSSTLPRIGRYLWLMLIATFVCYFPFALICGSYFLWMFLYVRRSGVLVHSGAAVDPGAALVFLTGTIVVFLLLVPAFVYAVWMALRYSLAIPASVVENLKARPALRRSIELSKGSRGRIFVLGLLIAVIQLGLVGITQIFFIVMAFKAVKHGGEVPAWMQVTQQIVGFFTNTFIGPMYATGLTLFYYDQRIRKEGFDIEWMMQAAGMTAPALNLAPQPTSEQKPAAQIEPRAQTESANRSESQPAIPQPPSPVPQDNGSPHD